MMLPDLIPGALELLKERARIEGRKEGRIEARIGQLKRVLTKKICIEPTEALIALFEKLSEKEIDKIEDKIFEITSWEDVEKLIK